MGQSLKELEREAEFAAKDDLVAIPAPSRITPCARPHSYFPPHYPLRSECFFFFLDTCWKRYADDGATAWNTASLFGSSIANQTYRSRVCSTSGYGVSVI